MTQVDFYLLGPASRERVMCVLAGKALQQGQALYIHAGTQDLALRYDDLLWTFRDVSFVPHRRVDDPGAVEATILIGYGAEPPAGPQLLLNMDGEVPGFADRYPRVLELVDADAPGRERGREHYRLYQQRGCEIRTHDLAGTHEPGW